MESSEQTVIKHISFDGTNNRYKMKKLIEEKSFPKIRKEIETWNLNAEFYKENMQYVLLENLYKITFNGVEIIPEYNLVKREIEKKLCGYKQQDIKKNRFLSQKFVDYKTVVHELYSSKMKCHYCSNTVFLLYEHVREKSQWTLDRIDNEIGHNQGNLLVCCLSCNLKRRKTNKESFFFTKNLNLVKSSELVS